MLKSKPPAAALEGCPIYVHDAHATSKLQLPPRYTDEKFPSWQHNQYAVELWLQRSIVRHPWRVNDPSQARIIFVAANFSLWCANEKRFSRRKLWKAVRQDPLLYPTAANRSSGRQPSIMLTSQYRFCGAPWDPAFLTGPQRPAKTLLLQDVIMGVEPSELTVISPFVVSKPPWLVGGR